MYQIIANMASVRLVAATVLLFLASSVAANSLTITEAAQLALLEDYTLKAINARSQSMTELAVAAEGLPDPQLKLGFANLPTDSFNLGQEPMTQFKKVKDMMVNKDLMGNLIAFETEQRRIANAA